MNCILKNVYFTCGSFPSIYIKKIKSFFDKVRKIKLKCKTFVESWKGMLIEFLLMLLMSGWANIIIE